MIDFDISEELPELPKKRSHVEADITPYIMDWFLENYDGDCAIEVKVGKNKVKEHQQIALKQVDEGRFAYKFPDMGRRNPFDVVILKKAKAIVVTCNGMECEAVEPNGNCFAFRLSKRKSPKQGFSL